MELHHEKCRYLMDDGSQCTKSTEENADLCSQHLNWASSDIEIFKVVIAHFQQDVREFWARSNFYLLVQAGLISVFVSTSNAASTNKVILGTLAVLGLIISLVWFVVARGAVLWIRRWRDQVIALDRIIDRHGVYEKVENFAYSSPLMSPSNVTQWLPLVFSIAWLLLFIVRIMRI